jgi:hypothetical protein
VAHLKDGTTVEGVSVYFYTKSFIPVVFFLPLMLLRLLSFALLA